MLELASVTEQGDLSPKSYSVEGRFLLLRGLWLFAPRETKVMTGWCSSRVLTYFTKQADSLVCFVEIEDVDFALLRVIGPVAVSCVDCAMIILSLSLLTCTTWVHLGVIDVVEINLLTKEMRGREVPPGVPEICTHKFRKSLGPMKLAKQNRKIMQTKYLLKLKYIVGTI